MFGQKFGWERANWFAPAGVAAEDHWSFRRSRWFGPVGEECRHVHEHVGILDMTAFAKCRVSRSRRGSLPRPAGGQSACRPSPGRVGLCHALNAKGGVHSEFTVLREGAQSFYLVSAGAWQRLDHDYLQKLMPADGSVRFSDLTSTLGVLVVAGAAVPNAAAARLGCGFRQRRLSLALRPAALNIGPSPSNGHAGELHRRARLGTAPSHGDAKPDIRCAV